MSIQNSLREVEGWSTGYAELAKLQILYRKYSFLKANESLVNSGLIRRYKRSLSQSDFLGRGSKYENFVSRIFKDLLKKFSTEITRFQSEYSFEDYCFLKILETVEENFSTRFEINYCRKSRNCYNYNLSINVYSEGFYRKLCQKYSEIASDQSYFRCTGLGGTMNAYGNRIWLSAYLDYANSWFFKPSTPDTLLDLIAFFDRFTEIVKEAYIEFFNDWEQNLREEATQAFKKIELDRASEEENEFW